MPPASELERLPVVDDVVRYRFKVRVGPGPFDVIRMHRVVKERRPFVPVDLVMKYEPGTVPDWVCPTAEWYRSRPSGDFADDMSFYATVGALAINEMDTWCDLTDVPSDDHLGDVRIPTLNMGAAGGFGQASVYSTTLLGSPDVTIRIVSLRPPGEKTLDFGHADLWLADNADKVAWPPILDWLKKH